MMPLLGLCLCMHDIKLMLRSVSSKRAMRSFCVCRPAAATSAAAVSLDASAGKAARPGARASSRSGASDQEQEAGPFDGVLLLQPQHYQ